MTNVVETVNSFLENFGLKNKTVCLGFSGGYDSMCLLHVLCTLRVKVIAVHLNHKWRGDESDREEENCRAFCEKMGVPFYAEYLSDMVPHTETAAREARYKFFEKCVQKYCADAFFTAHNADDNAETVLYRIIKGTGIDGLCAIASKRDCFYRPLLKVRRRDIEMYCENFGLTPNSDSSNYDVKYKRNLIRHEIIPLLNKINPQSVEALNSLSELAREDCELFKEYSKCRSTAELLNYSKSIQSRIIKNLLVENGLDYDRERIEYLLDFVNQNAVSKSGKRCSVSEKQWFYVNCYEFYITNVEKCDIAEVSVQKEGEYSFGEYIFSIEKCDRMPEKFPSDNSFTAYVHLDNIDFTLRTRHAGDVIRPLGISGTQKLKKYLNEKKIPSHTKDSIVLLCSGQEVLWVAGYGISNRLKIVDNNVTHVLKLRKREDI